MEILFSGHSTCLNRGCEALVRTMARDIAVLVPQARIRLPSATPSRDADVLSDLGVPVRTSARRFSLAERALRQAQQRRWPGSTAWAWPAPTRKPWRQLLRGTDQVFSVGGDTYSLDYGIPTSLLALDQCAVRRGIPVALWGASVGPFDAHPPLERLMARALRGYTLIGARESETREYLVDRLGLDNVVTMVDPAFGLACEPLPSAVFDHESPDRVIGLNLSSLVSRYGVEEKAFHEEAIRLIRVLASEPGQHLLLIPHVAHPEHTGKESDHDLLAQLLAGASLSGAQAARVTLLPGDLRAGQYRSAVGLCDVLVAARTHLTIAGYSQGVPTLSLGYSRKARGLAADIYGDRRFSLPVTEFGCGPVLECVDRARRCAGTLRARAVEYTQQGLERNRRLLRQLLDVSEERTE